MDPDLRLPSLLFLYPDVRPSRYCFLNDVHVLFFFRGDQDGARYELDPVGDAQYPDIEPLDLL